MKTKLKSFKDLIVWQLASQFSKDVYELTKKFPTKEKYSLTDDLLRAARSIPANISEGWGRRFPKEKISFYNIASGSAEECANHLIEAFNVGYLNAVDHARFQKNVHIISVKLTNLITRIRKDIVILRQRSVTSTKCDCNSASVPNVSTAQRAKVFP
ncbi:MAG TPA: four helix bundle protein [bacterium]